MVLSVRVPVFLALLSAATFGAATPVSKALLTTLSPFQLAGLLYLGAAAGLFPLMVLRGRLRSVCGTDRKTRERLLGAVLLGGVCGPVALLFGLRLASAASVSMWLNLELAATSVLGHFLFRDHVGRHGWLAVAGTLAASALLSWGEGLPGIPAGLLVALACLCWGFDNHLTALIGGLTPTETALWKGLVAGTTNLLIGLSAERLVGSGPTVASALILGALSYGVSIALYIASAQRLGATRSQMVFASAPFFGVILSILLLGETMSPSQGVAGVLLIGSLVFLFLDRHAHAHAHVADVHVHWHRHDDGHHTHIHQGLPVGGWHSHEHAHEPTVHAHPHWPDIHHRHAHD